jgi:signal transduction histidine kinase/streptogramin lyase
LEDRSGHFWLGTSDHGLFRFDTNGTVLQFTRKDGLSSDSVRVVFEDSEGNIWVGTEGGGLSRLHLPLFGVYGSDQGLPAESVTGLSEGPDHRLWVGTYGFGLKSLAAEGGAAVRDEPATARFHILTALADRQGDIWLGTGPGGVYRCQSGTLTRLQAFPTNGPIVRSLFEDSKGGIWFGRRNVNTLVRIQDGNPTLMRLPESLGVVDVRVIVEDAEGAHWIGTDGTGLLRWKNERFTRFTRENGLSSDYIWSLHPEPNGGLWIGTYGGGLTRLKDGRAAICSTRHGLTDDVICSIIDDGRGQFWFSSHQGIFRASTKELNRFADGALEHIQCIAYSRSDGLPVLECKGGFQPAACRTQDGKLWFPTIRGLVVVDPGDLSTNTVAPPVHIEDILLDGKVLDTALWQTEEVSGKPGAGTPVQLKIPSRSRRLAIRYTGLSFSTPEKVRFRHKLDGVDADWVETGGQRLASYDRLPHGTYTFRVQACNREGVWSAQSACIAFLLPPALWQTWWFEGLSFLTFGGGVGWGVGHILRRRHRRHLRLVERLHSLERERVRVARDIHDDLGTSLTAIGFWGAWAARDSKTLPEAQEQLLSIADRTRELGRKLDETVWAVSPKNDSSGRLATYLCRYVEEFLEPRNIRCRLHVAPELPEVEFTTETRHSILLVVKEAVNNAAKHAKATELTLRVAADQGMMVIEISDNGEGFAPETVAQKGNGLHNMAARMAELGGQFEVRTQSGKGTTICLRLPLPIGEDAKLPPPSKHESR